MMNESEKLQLRIQNLLDITVWYKITSVTSRPIFAK